MKLIEQLNKGSKELGSAGIENARGEALMLLKYAYDIGDNQWPLISAQEREETAKYFDLIKRRQEGEPVQYIMGYAYFYGRKFLVQSGVLIPRFDTETLVSEAINEAKKIDSPKVLDMCAGSGCIGLTIALEVKTAHVTLSDIEKECLDTIEANARELFAQNITIINSNLFLCIEGIFDIIAINPPYISDEEYRELDKEVLNYEPKVALHGGTDGLMYYRLIAEKALDYLSENGLLLLEIGYNQAEAVTELLQNKGFKRVKTIKDLSGKDRVISARKLLRS